MKYKSFNGKLPGFSADEVEDMQAGLARQHPLGIAFDEMCRQAAADPEGKHLFF